MTARHIPSHLVGMQWDIESSFGTGTGSMATLHRAQNIVFVPTANMHAVEASKTSGMRGPESSLFGGKGGTLTFDLPLHTMGGSEAPAISLMRACGGTRVSVAAAAGDVTDGTAITMDFLDGDIGNIAVGTAVLHDSALGTDSIRFVEDVADAGGTTTITVNAPWATTPVAADGWTAVDTITPSTNVEPDTYMSFNVFQGQGSTDRLKWALTGCAGKWTLATTEADGLPMISFEFSVDGWTPTEANLAQTTFAGNEVAPLLGDCFYIDGAAVATKSIGFDPQFDLQPIPSTCGTNGREGWAIPNSLGKLDILPRHDVDFLADWEAATEFDAFFESLTSTTNSFAIWVPASQILSYELGDSEGLLRSTMEIQATDPGVDAADNLIPQWAIAITK